MNPAAQSAQDPTWLDWFWPVWLLVLLVGFAVAETTALVHKGKGGALTEFTKRALGVDPPRPRRQWAIAMFAAALFVLTFWLVPHMTHWPFRWFWE